VATIGLVRSAQVQVVTSELLKVGKPMMIDGTDLSRTGSC